MENVTSSLSGPAFELHFSPASREAGLSLVLAHHSGSPGGLAPGGRLGQGAVPPQAHSSASLTTPTPDRGAQFKLQFHF